MVKKGKKKGSTILMVLMVSTILIIVSAVMMNSLVITAHANDLSKSKSDYVYAAEGGIEYGIQKYSKSGLFTTVEEVSFLGNPSAVEKKDIYKVKVSCSSAVGTDKLTSKVFNKDGDILAEITVPLKIKTGMSKILEYTMASAKDIKVIGTGSINYQIGKVAYNTNAGGTWTQDGGTSIQPKVEDVKMKKPEFKPELVDTNVHPDLNIERDGFENFSQLVSYIKTGVEIDENASSGKLEDGIGYKIIDGYTVLFIKRDKIVIKNVDSLDKVILVTNGEVEVNGVSSTMSKCTIYASKVTVNVSGTLHFAGSPLYDGTAAENHKTVPYLEIVNGYPAINNNIKLATLQKIDKLLATYLSSFGAESNISGIPEINYGDMEYKY